jgi:hypothetical protein
VSAHKYNHQKTTNPFHLYRVYDSDRRLLYIGITTSVVRRVYEHRMTKGWWPKDAIVESQLIGPRVIAQAAEAAAIQDEGPGHNFSQAKWSGAGRALRAHMDQMGLTAEDIAKTANVDASVVQRWLVNRSEVLAAEFRQRYLARARQS